MQFDGFWQHVPVRSLRAPCPCGVRAASSFLLLWAERLRTCVRLGVDTGFRCCGCGPRGEVWFAWASLLRSYQTASPLVAPPGVRSRNAPHGADVNGSQSGGRALASPCGFKIPVSEGKETERLSWAHWPLTGPLVQSVCSHLLSI